MKTWCLSTHVLLFLIISFPSERSRARDELPVFIGGYKQWVRADIIYQANGDIVAKDKSVKGIFELPQLFGLEKAYLTNSKKSFERARLDSKISLEIGAPKFKYSTSPISVFPPGDAPLIRVQAKHVNVFAPYRLWARQDITKDWVKVAEAVWHLGSGGEVENRIYKPVNRNVLELRAMSDATSPFAIQSHLVSEITRRLFPSSKKLLPHRVPRERIFTPKRHLPGFPKNPLEAEFERQGKITEKEHLKIDRNYQIDDRIPPSRISLVKNETKFELEIENKLPIQVKGKIRLSYNLGKGVETLDSKDIEVDPGDRKKLLFQTPAYSRQYLKELQGGEVISMEDVEFRAR